MKYFNYLHCYDLDQGLGKLRPDAAGESNSYGSPALAECVDYVALREAKCAKNHFLQNRYSDFSMVR